MADKSNGIVYLVGAGPGDPGLLTLRGAELLAAADVVVYDHLASPELLSHAPKAKVIYVGKQSAAHTLTQDQINALLVQEAKAGRRVVRLKGGDPFVFGRGGEECQVLRDAGIPFEIVPGITSAIAAAAYAGIPVTHRDFNTSFTLVTGHEQEGAETELDWPTLSRLPCVAFYMGVKSLGRIRDRLIAHGREPSTPVAVIQWGTTSRQRTVIATLADLPERVAEAKLTPPAITLIGKVVTLRPALNWFETRPLFGQTVIVTRSRAQASELSRKLIDLGARVLEAPGTELVAPASWSSVDTALLKANEYDWIVFTSANGVKFTRQRLCEIGKDVRLFGRAKIAAIGQTTAAAVRDELALQVDLIPKQFVAEVLAEELIQNCQPAGKKFLLLRADAARPILLKELTEAGATVQDIAVYESRPAEHLPESVTAALAGGEVNWITFASGGTARNFTRLLGEGFARKLTGIKLASIGPVTTSALRELGLEPSVQAETFNLDSMVAAMAGK